MKGELHSGCFCFITPSCLRKERFAKAEVLKRRGSPGSEHRERRAGKGQSADARAPGTIELGAENRRGLAARELKHIALTIVLACRKLSCAARCHNKTCQSHPVFMNGLPQKKLLDNRCVDIYFKKTCVHYLFNTCWPTGIIAPTEGHVSGMLLSS